VKTPHRRSLTPGAEIELSIEKPVAGGRMLARHHGEVVLVGGAIPGEQVRARVERVSGQVAFAQTISVLQPSGDRRGTDGDGLCGGSVYAHIAYPRQLSLKADIVADSCARIGKFALSAPVAVTPSKEEGYRMRARLHARGGQLGFFREGTHELCNARPTRQLLPATHDALDRARGTFGSRVAAGLAGCELLENVAANERVALFEIEDLSQAPLAVDPVEGITGLLFVDHHSAKPSVAFGSPYVTDTVAFASRSIQLTHHVQSFFQGNRYLLATLLERVLAQVPDGSVTDLYAGVGVFAVALAARGGGKVTAVESDRSSARDMEANAEPFGASLRARHESVEEHLEGHRGPKPDTVLVDPPRTGLSPSAISGIVHLKPPRVVYLSCDPATLARDTRRFVEAGYTLGHIEAFDLFPNTAHVETLVTLTI
jgi:23S rRNA (uracil1939-C5)-methyltransferase